MDHGLGIHNRNLERQCQKYWPAKQFYWIAVPCINNYKQKRNKTLKLSDIHTILMSYYFDEKRVTHNPPG